MITLMDTENGHGEVDFDAKEVRQENPRTRLLREADQIVNGDRNAQYGDPNQDFKRTAALWNTYLAGVLERKIGYLPESEQSHIRFFVEQLIDPHDVGWMMILLKSSRATVSPHKFDNYLDAAGYSACAWDCAVDVLKGPTA